MSGIAQRGVPPDAAFRPGPDSQAVFRVVLDAMARPGTVGTLPAVDRDAPGGWSAALCAVARTLLDHEVTMAVVGATSRVHARVESVGAGLALPGGVVTDVGRARPAPTTHAQTAPIAPSGDGDVDAIDSYLRSWTGSRTASVDEADYVLVLGRMPDGLPAQLRRGVPAYPDEGATLIARVPPLDGTGGLVLHLDGPGVAPGLVSTIPGWSDAALAGLADANAAPPLGIDVILVDDAGRVLCLPRSTRFAVNESEGAGGLHRG